MDLRADIFALGLILNEMFTSEVPQGTGYRTIGSRAPEFAWLDDVIAQLIQFDPAARPNGIAAVRELLRTRSEYFETQQRLSAASREVVSTQEIDDPLATEAPAVVGVDYDGRELIITLDREISDGWVDALRNMGSYSSAWNAGPETFRFAGNKARVSSDAPYAQMIIDHFKVWLPRATAVYKERLIAARLRKERERSEELRRRREELERIQRVRSSLTF